MEYYVFGPFCSHHSLHYLFRYLTSHSPLSRPGRDPNHTLSFTTRLFLVSELVATLEYTREKMGEDSEPAISVEGEFTGGVAEVGIGEDDLQLGHSLPVLRSTMGIGYGQGESDGMDGGETNQRDLRPHPHLRIGSGSSQERRDVDGKRPGRADPHPQSDREGNDTYSFHLARWRSREYAKHTISITAPSHG